MTYFNFFFIMILVIGEALVFSSMHVSGEQLAQLSGIAAVLRFPLEELADTDLEAPF